MLGIVTGLKSEARILCGLDLRCISIGGKADNAAAKIERLIASGVTGLVSFGIAGALHPELKRGDVVVADAVVDESGQSVRTHPEWVRAISTTTQARDDERVGGHGGAILGGAILGGAILGLDRLLSSPSEKAAAFARSGAVAIDMESHHVARAAAAHGLPFVAVRAISDRAGEALPACFADFVDGEGATKLSAVFTALISGRVGLGQLIAAGRSSRRAHRALFGCRGAVAGLR